MPAAAVAEVFALLVVAYVSQSDRLERALLDRADQLHGGRGGPLGDRAPQPGGARRPQGHRRLPPWASSTMPRTSSRERLETPAERMVAPSACR